MTTDLSTMLAKWKSGSFNERPTKALLGYLEKSFKNKQARLTEYGPPATAKERGELNELKREFRSDWNRMRAEILEGYDADISTMRRTANPPLSDAMLTRMGLLSGVHLPVWQRSPGDMIRRAEQFGLEGDEAGLRLVEQHAGLVKESGPRRALVEGVGEALDGYKSDASRQAEQQVQTLEGEREQFRSGTGMRQNGMIRAMSEPVGPPPRTPSPIAGSPAPQR